MIAACKPLRRNVSMSSRKVFLAFSLLAVFSLSACAGGGDSPQLLDGDGGTGGTAAQSVCTPANTTPGQEIVCEPPAAFTDGCTCFFSQTNLRTPVECALNDDHKLAMTSPLRSGEFSIEIQCGDSDAVPVTERYQVRPLTDVTATGGSGGSGGSGAGGAGTGVAGSGGGNVPVRGTGCTANTDCPSSTPICNTGTGVCGTCTTNAQCSTGMQCQSGACVAQAPQCPATCPSGQTCNTTSGRCENTLIACTPACSSSQTCQAGRCVDNTPSVPSVTLTATQSNRRLGLYQLEWRIQNVGTPREAYIYGKFSDSNDCSQNLVVDPSGSNLNSGSPNFANYRDYYSGSECNESGRGDSARCILAGSSFLMPRTMIPIMRMVPDEETPARMERFDPSILGRVITTIPGLEPPETLCRINLRNHLNGNFYTVLHKSPAKYRVVVLAQDGRWYSSERELALPDTSRPLITISPQISSTEPAITINGSYSNAVEVPSVTGCSVASTSPTPRSPSLLGTGTFEFKCDLNSSSGNVTVTVPGIGILSAEKSFRFECGEPEVEVITPVPLYETSDRGARRTCENATSSSCTSSGFLNLEGTATRTCTITQVGVASIVKKVPWGLEMSVTANDSACQGQIITPISVNYTPRPAHLTLPEPANDTSPPTAKAKLTTRIQKNDTCYEYTVTAIDESGRSRSSIFNPYRTQTTVFAITSSLEGLPSDYAYRTESSVQSNIRVPNDSLDWRFDFTATDAVDDGGGDDYCTPDGSLGSVDNTSHNPDNSDERWCWGFPVKPANQLCRGNGCDVGCRHSSDWEGFAMCTRYRLENPQVSLRVENIRNISVNCCEYGEGRSIADLGNSRRNCSYQPTQAALRFLPLISVSDRPSPPQSITWSVPQLKGEAMHCTFTAHPFTGEPIIGRVVFERPAGACDGPDMDSSSFVDEDDSDHYRGNPE